LLIQGDQDGTARGVKATGPRSAVADIPNHIAYEMDEIHLGFGGDFARDHAKTGIHNRFAGHPARAVLG
jgi:hypothetical protein